MIKPILAFLVSFFIGMALAPIIIFLIKKLKARQTILSYVEQHKEKSGIPTMGGVIFILSAIVATLLFWEGSRQFALVAMGVMLAYGIIGGLDDVIKVVFKRNLGLKAYQKILSQLAIAAFATYFCYQNGYIGTSVTLPIVGISVNFQWWYFPLSIFIYLAVTNAVNLTDGLDGLAGSTVSVYLAAFFAVISLLYFEAEDMGRTFYAQELYNSLIFIAALVGGIVAFLWYNSNKAKVFMGDTGSLALGGVCAFLPLATKNPFLIVFAGIMFVVSSISVIIQVSVYKLKKRRVFLMAPFHHHLEMKGINESKIVSYYTIVTVIGGLVAIIIM